MCTYVLYKGETMKNIFNATFIFILLLSSLAAAVFMILESGNFYQTLYESKSSFYGYWAASLNEVFMAIMAAVWVSKKDENGNNQSHIINYFFKILLGILFITTIGGACYYAASPILDDIQKQKNQSELLKIIDLQISNDKKSLEIFSSQNQRGNTALAVKRTWNSHQEAKQLVQKGKHMFLLWLQLAIIILLRLGIQSSNLGCVWLAGWIYRNNFVFSDNVIKKQIPIKKRINPKVSAQQQKDIQSIPAEKIRKQSIQTQLANIKNNSTGAKSVVKQKVNSPQRQIRDLKVAKLINRNNFQKEKKNIPRTKLPIKGNETLNFQSKELLNVRKKIVELLNLRNEGVLIRDIAASIETTERSILDIQDLKIPNHYFKLNYLESILSSLNTIFNHESAGSF